MTREPRLANQRRCRDPRPTAHALLKWRGMKITLTSIAALAALAAPAAADEAVRVDARAPATYSFGARVGGYGFRQVEGDARSGWNDCRMNGIGIFAQRSLARAFFVEGATDVYFAESFPQAHDPSEDGMDRLSGLLSVAAGARMMPTDRITGYVQLGGGLELTRVVMHHDGGESRRNDVMPMGFIGFGGSIRVGDKVRLGANLRVNMMAHYPHAHVEHTHDEPEMEPAGPMPLDPEPEAAAQGQFFLSYDL
jgi:hypothetical protein